MGILDYLMSESLTKPFLSDQNKDLEQNLSNDPNILQTTKTLSDNSLEGAMVVNSSETIQDFDYGSIAGEDKFMHQNRVIQSYRELVTDQEVSNGVDIVVNELIWTIDNDVFKISIDEENEQISDVINEGFKKVLRILNIRDNIFHIGRQMYIDGQLNVSLGYDKRDVKGGIQTAKILEPFNLYFDIDKKIWRYKEAEQLQGLYFSDELDLENRIEFTEPELVHIDYGLYTRIIKESEMPYQINLSYLENVFKNANMLQTLENMLVPMRYSRSVSRRLFNIDVAELPPKQAKELMDKIRSEFRYKKNYDPATGTIKNMRNTQPLVEDYWMSNRGGSKGTEVDTMDERGAILDLEDIMHAAKKLYGSMKIPSSRNPYSDDQTGFSFDNTEVTQEELSFYIFVNRLRIPIAKLIKEILRRELVATGVFMDSEWKKYSEKIEIDFTSNQIFLENMEKDMFQKNTESFANIKEHIGQTVSLETAVAKTFSWSSEQLEEELDRIEKEKVNPKYKAFYDRDQEFDQGPAW